MKHARVCGSKNGARECLGCEVQGLAFKGLPGPSNVDPFWVWYGFGVKMLIRTPKKVLRWRVQVGFRV